jgi:hypothetical protein
LVSNVRHELEQKYRISEMPLRWSAALIGVTDKHRYRAQYLSGQFGMFMFKKFIWGFLIKTLCFYA